MSLHARSASLFLLSGSLLLVCLPISISALVLRHFPSISVADSLLLFSTRVLSLSPSLSRSLSPSLSRSLSLVLSLSFSLSPSLSLPHSLLLSISLPLLHSPLGLSVRLELCLYASLPLRLSMPASPVLCLLSLLAPSLPLPPSLSVCLAVV